MRNLSFVLIALVGCGTVDGVSYGKCTSVSGIGGGLGICIPP